MTPEAVTRVSLFLVILAVCAAGEQLFPRRPRYTARGKRWFVNLSMAGLGTVAVRVIFPVLPVAAAAYAEDHSWGLLHFTDLPPAVAATAGFLLLDLVIYLQHLQFHRLPLLWRLHRVHHSDLDLDVTSGVRFHPLEICISLVIKLAAVVIIGVPAQAVLLFEAVLNACAMFNHSNIALPESCDRFLRLLLVTPDVHRVHHSVIVRETNSNYGFNFPWWDRLFGTYRPEPLKGHLEMTIGLKEFREPQHQTLLQLLFLPFRQIKY